MRIALGLEYDGSCFHGWQRQKNIPQHKHTVQACLEQALSSIADCEVRTVAAGRTDVGVHACRQIIHFDTAAERVLRAWREGVNSLLPTAIRVLWAHPVDPNFHARFSALARRYRYLICDACARPALFRAQLDSTASRLDTASMHEAGQMLVGEHDFQAFCAVKDPNLNTVRKVDFLRVLRCGRMVVIDVQANAFLWRMVRKIVGALKQVGCGEQPPYWVRDSLLSADRQRIGIPASAAGLYLLDVLYPAAYVLPSARGGYFCPALDLVPTDFA